MKAPRQTSVKESSWLKLKFSKWRIESFVARRCFDVVCLSYPHMRGFVDIMLPEFGAEPDWKSGLGYGVHTLYAAVRSLRPEVVVEIGSARGLSTCSLALACQRNNCGKVYAIDPNTPNAWSELQTSGDNFEFLLDRVRRYDLEGHVELLRMTSREAARDWHRPIDFLFIDGDHSYEGVKHDFEVFRPWLSDRALVAFHDSMWEHRRGEAGYRPDMGVPRYLHELQAEGFQSVTFTSTPGFTLMRATPGAFPFVPEQD